MAAASETDDAPRSRWLLAVAAVTAASSLWLAMRLPLAMDSYRGMFQSLGVTPSRTATWLFSYPKAWWLFAISSVAVLLWILLRSHPNGLEQKRMKLVLQLIIAATALAYGFAAITLYRQVAALGAVV